MYTCGKGLADVSKFACNDNRKKQITLLCFYNLLINCKLLEWKGMRCGIKLFSTLRYYTDLGNIQTKTTMSSITRLIPL